MIDIKKTVIEYFKASNPAIFFVSEETFQVQTGVEQAVEELNEERSESNKVRLALHDPLVGFHYGRFTLNGVCGPDGAMADLTQIIEPSSLDKSARNIQIGPQWNAIEPLSDIIVVLKGWENLIRGSAMMVQALSNVFQGNLCAHQWEAFNDNMDVDEIEEAARNMLAGCVDVEGRRYVGRGRRMLVFISKTDDIPAELSEIRPIHVPLPGHEQFVALVEKQWSDLEGRDNKAGVSYTAGVDDEEAFRRHVAGALAGFPLSAGEDALMLSIVENGGFDKNGTLATIERLKAASISRVPGLMYKPRSAADQDSVILPGYEPVRSFLAESNDMDPEFARTHAIKALSGLLLVGPPGTGKTVVSDQVANELGLPQLIWSLGESQGAHVSESERHTRKVIDTANILRAALTLDDADKAGLNTDRVANDGGVFDRMINIILTEMSNPDCKITWIINGNRIQCIRPELYRDGRLDERFFVDLPDQPLRLEILKYHMRKHRFPDGDFVGLSEGASEIALTDLSEDGSTINRRTNGWSGAELAGLVVRAGRHAAMTRCDKLDVSYMLALAKDKTPQSLQPAVVADYAEMRKLCLDFTRVGVSDAGKSLAASGPMESRRRADIT